MTSTVNVALVGICGYGGSYLNALLDARRANQQGVRLAGVVDPSAERSPRFGELRERGVPVYPDLAALYAGPAKIHLTSIVSPIHLHCRHTCAALSHGSNVLCEKPLGATAADARQVIEAAEHAPGKPFVAVGFQWCFSQAVQALKADVMSGVLGKAKRLRVLVMFPRGDKYYRRNKWAGRIRADDGSPVFDSPLNNATAHYLQNMLYVLGPTRETSAWPATVEAELYRANEIENYDTAALRVRTACNAELLFYTTHATPQHLGPICRYEFEHAATEFHDADGARFVARFHDGRTVDYGQPDADRTQKIWQSIAAVRTGAPVACDAKTSLPHAVCVEAAQQSAGEIANFPATMLSSATADRGGGRMVCVEGLAETLKNCFDSAVLPSEAGNAWARAGQRVEVAGA
jgi:predicted dehydrogenase